MDAHGHQLLLPSEGTRGPVVLAAYSGFYGFLTERPSGSPALSGRQEGAGSRIPLAAPPDTTL